MSYSACGIPYWVGGDVDSDDRLVAPHRGAAPRARHRPADAARGHRARPRPPRGHGARPRRRLDVPARLRPARDRHRRRAAPARRARAPTPTASTACRRWTTASACSTRWPARPRRAVVVGGGYIGIEMAEALVSRGLAVTVVDRPAEPMTTLDPDMGRLVHEAMEGMGIDVRTVGDVAALRGRRRRSRAGGRRRRRDVRRRPRRARHRRAPRTPRWPRAAGLPLGDGGGLRDRPADARRRQRRRLGRRRLRRDARPGLAAAASTSRWAPTRTSTAA